MQLRIDLGAAGAVMPECSALRGSERELLNRAKWEAHAAYLNAAGALNFLDETANPHVIHLLETARDNAWRAHEALVLETEW